MLLEKAESLNMPTKDDLIEAIVRKVGLSKRQAQDSLTVALDEITKTLSRGEDVVLTGFGKFLVKQRGEKKLAKFKPGQALKDAVR